MVVEGTPMMSSCDGMAPSSGGCADRNSPLFLPSLCGHALERPPGERSLSTSCSLGDDAVEHIILFCRELARLARLCFDTFGVTI